MSERAERQKKLLLYLFIAFGVVISWRMLPGLFESTGAASRAHQERMAQIRSGEIVSLEVAALEADSQSYTPGRNIFLFGRDPAPPPPPLPPPPEPIVRRPSPVQPPPPVVPTPPKFSLPLIGIFGPEHRRIAVFKDREVVLNVLENDTIEEKFIVQQINFETVDIAFVGFPDATPHRVKMGK